MAGKAQFEVFPEMREIRTTAPRVIRTPTGQFRWRFRAANGKISGNGGEGFTRREDANRAIHDFLRDVTGAEPHPVIVDVDD